MKWSSEVLRTKFHLCPQIYLCRVNRVVNSFFPKMTWICINPAFRHSYRQRSSGYKDMSSRLERYLQLLVVLLQIIHFFLCWSGKRKSLIPSLWKRFHTVYRQGSFVSIASCMEGSSHVIIEWFICQNLICIRTRVQIHCLQARMVCPCLF